MLSALGLESLCIPGDGNAGSATTVELSAYSTVALGEGRGDAALQGVLDCLAMAGPQELYRFGPHYVCRAIAVGDLLDHDSFSGPSGACRD